MVAQVNREAFLNIMHTPAPDPADSPDISLALETARVLEAGGDFEEATRWIRRAADYAEREGHDERVLMLARAAADLTQTIADHAKTKQDDVAPSSVPTLNVRGRQGSRPTTAERDAKAGGESKASPSTPPSDSQAPAPTLAHRMGMPPMLAALVASLPSFSARSSSSAPPPPKAQAHSSSPASPPPSPSPTPEPSLLAAPPVSGQRARGSSAPSDKPPTERTMRIGAIRVAIRGSIHEAKSLSVERLDRDEPAPAGSIEAMLVLTGPIDGSLEIATNLPVGDIEARPH
jgi:hypothetical protein